MPASCAEAVAGVGVACDVEPVEVPVPVVVLSPVLVSGPEVIAEFGSAGVLLEEGLPAPPPPPQAARTISERREEIVWTRFGKSRPHECEGPAL